MAGGPIDGSPQTGSVHKSTKPAGECALPPSTEEVLKFYERLPRIYAPNDYWLCLSHEWIRQFVRSEVGDMARSPRLSCLNLGSGGLSYDIEERAMLHVDIHSARFTQGQSVVVADIQKLPPFAKCFHECLCVGSVLNHCDAAAVISSAANAIRPGGRFIIEFETSRSLELLFSRHFGQSATVIRTFYQDRTIRLWAYSERYIRSLLRANHFEITRRSSRHHVSPLVYLLIHNSNFAARFAWLDTLARRTPILRNFASHVIYSCRKSL